jgi:methionyl-tRNA formyltransferase
MTTVFALLDGELSKNIRRIIACDKGIELLDVRADECSEVVQAAEPDLILSVGYKYILDKDTISAANRAVNLHWSYLPTNRGANTNVWSIIEDAPAGVTIHEMVPGVDAGPIVDRRRVEIRPDDTGKSLYDRLMDAQLEQFADLWPSIRDGTYTTTEQDEAEATLHYSREFDDMCELHLEEATTWREAIDRLRALTYPPYQNAYFEVNGEKYYVDIDITRESSDLGGPSKK